MIPIMKDKTECVVTGREINEPEEAPHSKVNDVTLLFCTPVCKEIFDQNLVKFAKKRYPANDHRVHFAPLNLKYKP